MNLPPNRLKAALAGHQLQMGLWTCLSSSYSTELLAGSGYDWLTLDMEHSPNDLATVLGQLQALGGYPVEPVLRLLRFDRDLVKQYLDMGVRTLVLPNVESADEARAIVQATRYPPDGVRGVSGLQRANRWGRISGYHASAPDQLCILAQIESAAGIANAGPIAAVEGIDGFFVGPSDLAASLGHMGQPQQKQVQAAIAQALAAATAAGKGCGILARNAVEAQAYHAMGYCMLGLGTDQGLLAKASDDLVAQFRDLIAKESA
ncbi:MAG: 2,4-dihydroxyhept-2-ene,7-dioic acid aldolase [Pseudomonadota bacterium]